MNNDMHLVIKYQYHGWNVEDDSILTMDEHLKITKKFGKVWWGRTGSISVEKAEILKHQLSNGIPTYAFLYAIWVPKDVNQDGHLWHRAKIKEVLIGNPESKELIPDYYKGVNLAVAFLIEDIQPINFPAGQMPKVPGQASLRYVTFKGEPDPKSLLVADGTKSLYEWFEGAEVINQSLVSSIEKMDESDQSAKNKIINLQETIIELQSELRILSEYRNQFQKILNADYLFSSEKFLETWIEENIHKIANNLVIIDRQPSISWSDGKFGRLDLLAMDRETKDFVIIEVKTRKRDKRSGYDQFLRYTTWAKKNLNALEKKYSSFGLKPTKDLTFMIITDFVDEEMTEICKEHNISLLKIFGGLGFEKVA